MTDTRSTSSPSRRRAARRARVLAALLLAAAPAAGDDAASPPGAVADPVADARARAAEAYDRGDCRTVLATLGELPHAGVTLDGIDEYRRGFCLARTRQAGAQEAYETSAALLSEMAAKDAGVPLETHFYRVNAYLNLGRTDDASAAAAEAVARWKAGSLVVAQDDPSGWFRLGKLFRDADDAKGALGPFRRALDAASPEAPLRSAYLQRIARVAREAGDTALATRASEMDAASGATGPEAQFRAARVLVTRGKLEEAREAFFAVRRLGGATAMKAQYATESMERALELARWERAPATALPDGRPIAALENGELQAELFGTAREAALLFQQGEYVTRARKDGTGVIYKAAPAVLESLRDLQARFAGLLLEAVQRDAPIREWAVSGGYANMTHAPLQKIFRGQARARAAEAGESPLPQE